MNKKLLLPGIALICGLLVFAAVIFVVQKQQLYPAFEVLESEQAQADYSLVSEILDGEVNHLGVITDGWANSDALYSYVQNPQQEFVDKNLQLPFLKKTLNINLVYIIDKQGTVVFGRGYDGEKNSDLNFKEFSSSSISNLDFLLAGSSGGHSASGILYTEQGPLFIASRAILASDGQGPTVGTLIFGRLLDKPLLAQLFKQAGSDFTLIGRQDRLVSVYDRNLLSNLKEGERQLRVDSSGSSYVYGAYTDVQKGKSLLLKVATSGNISEVGTRATLTIFILTMSMIAFAIIALLMFFGHRSGEESTVAHKRIVTAKKLSTLSLIVIVGLATTLTTYILVNRANDLRMATIFKNESAVRADSIQKIIEQRLAELDTIRNFYGASSVVEAPEFSAFTAPIVKQSGFAALGWVPRVSGAEKGDYERKGRWTSSSLVISQMQNGIIVSSTPRSEYFPLTYMEPAVGNGFDLGLDFGFDAALRLVMDKAVDSGISSVSGRTQIGSFGSQDYIFLVFTPVYKKNADILTLQGRRSGLMGLLVGVIRPRDMVGNVIDSFPGKKLLTWFEDLSAMPADKLLYYYKPKINLSEAGFGAFFDRQPKMEFKKQFDFAGRLLQVRIEADNAFFLENHSYFPLFSGISGLVFTLLLLMFIRSNIEARNRIENLVVRRTGELSLTQAKYRLFLDNFPGIAYQVTLPDFNPIFIHGNIKDITGFNDDDFVSLKVSWPQLIHSDDLKVYNQFRQRIAASSGYRDQEYRIIKANGQVIWVREVSRQIVDNGQLLLQGSIYNISKVKEAELLLAQQKSFSQQVIDALPMPVYYTDLSGAYLGCNKAYENFFGKTAVEITGKTAYQVWPKSLADIYASNDKEVISSQSSLVYDRRIKKGDDSEVDIVVYKAPFYNLKNSMAGIVCGLIDISDRKKIEAALLHRQKVLWIINSIAELLLKTKELNADINKAFSWLGELVAASRVSLYANIKDDKGDNYFSLRYEWSAPGIKSAINDPRVKKMSYKEFLPSWHETFVEDQSFILTKANASPAAAAFLAEYDVKTMLLFPVYIDDKFWGMMTFNQCSHDREWHPEEIEILATAVKIIAISIDRKNIEDGLAARNLSLETTNSLMNDREIRIVQLKKEVNDLLKKIGEKPKYVS